MNSILFLTLLTALPSTPPMRADFIRGIGFAHVHVPTYGYGSARAAKELDRIRGLGADWIALNPFAYMKRVDRPDISFRRLDPTMLDGDLIKQTRDAHDRGLKVLLKPHIWSNEFWNGGKWHGDIYMSSEAEMDDWFANYTQFMINQAQIATSAGADALSIGLEYVKMTGPQNTSRWRKVIAAVKQHYKGPLTYGAHHEREAFQIEFWDQLDAIGVHGYYPLLIQKSESELTAEDVAAAWEPHLDRLAPLVEKFGKPIVFTEVGYPSHRGALREPWKSDNELPKDERLQAVAYQGTLAAFDAAPFVRGVFFWKWFSGGTDNPAEEDPYEPADKEAESVLRRWFRR